ncbi:Uncharacterised protein [Mycobacteroides abscessus subsp. massiliense]|nr:Uncharacterised protein [Mycobacteroides abscessus subsp. massiliense]
MRLASAVSNCEYRYTSSSTGSTKRCRPSPVCEYSRSASTTTVFVAASPSSVMPFSSSYPLTSSSTPLSSARRTVRAAISITVEAPGCAVKVTVVDE